MRAGSVMRFDDVRGLGEVVDDATGVGYVFHCIEIADGTRTIADGSAVTFEIRRKLGRLEAASLRPR